MEDFFSLQAKGGVCGRGVFLIYALSLRLPCSMNKIKKKKKKPIGIDDIVVELTRRVNDFRTVYLERKRESV